MRVFRTFSRLVEAIERLATLLGEAVERQREAGPALDRLEALEMSRHQFEAEIEGVLLKAEGKRQAAENAEARSRTMKKAYENRLADPFDPEEPATEGNHVRAGDAERSETEGMHALRMDVEAPDSKTLALRAKFQL